VAIRAKFLKGYVFNSADFPKLPYSDLSEGVTEARVSWRQSIRDGKNEGELIEIEELGVESKVIICTRLADLT